MNWNDRSREVPEGSHAFLGASRYSWLNYDDDTLKDRYINHIATQRGTILHDFACQCIRLKQKLPNAKQTLNMYVNDCISFGMDPERPLYYSSNCFGTADAIGFRKRFLRVSDLKTGKSPTSLKQPLIYAALFCLEYNIMPNSMNGCELRIYQNDDIMKDNPDPDEILKVMDKIVHADKIIEKLKEEGHVI